MLMSLLKPCLMRMIFMYSQPLCSHIGNMNVVSFFQQQGLEKWWLLRNFFTSSALWDQKDF